ncbi:MAG: AMP-binding protein [Chloroflexi bacterium]|nr:AMP-binding protein [Chloroflexota bacterium]
MPTKKLSLDAQLARHIQHAYAHAPGVKKIFDAAGVKPAAIKHVADLERVPVTSKDMLAELQKQNPPFGGFLAVDARKLKHIFLSPGPLYEPHGAEKALAAVFTNVFRAAGFKRGDVVLNTLSYHLVPAGLLLDHALQSIGATVVPSGVGNTELQVKMMLDLRVTGYAGTPSFLMTLIKKAEEMGLDFKKQFALSHTLFSAEPYAPSLRVQFEGTYGLKTMNVYATAELGALAYDIENTFSTPDKSALQLVAGAVIELVDRETGKRVGARAPGEVVVTTFNETYPLIRLGTGDMAIYTDDSLRNIMLVGRAGEAVKVRGMFVHPNQLKLAASKFPAIARVQGIVTRPNNVRDDFALKVELADEAADREKLRAEYSAAVQGVCRVSVDRIEFVAKGMIGENARGMVDERKWE